MGEIDERPERPDVPMTCTRIGRDRRRQLFRLADEITDQIADKISPHEYCLFRRMCEVLLGEG